MEFVYLGYDFLLEAAHRLMNDGHSLKAIYTFPCDNKTSFNSECHALANALNIPVSEEPINIELYEAHVESGVTCFVSAGYLNKIPVIDRDDVYALNVHPALLPKGRGLLPVPKIIMDSQDAAGVTVHKISEAMDAGDIIAQKAFKLSDRDTVESYGARMLLVLPDMISRICADLPASFEKATPQDEDKAETYPMPDQQMCLIDWTHKATEIDAQLRAFGRYGALMVIDNAVYSVFDHDVLFEDHDHSPGSCLVDLQNLKVVAVPDGYIIFKEFSFVQPVDS